MHETSAWTWCTGKTQRDRVEREVRLGEIGREGRLGWGIHVYPWLIHVNVWQKPLQYCKVISLQLIKKKMSMFTLAILTTSNLPWFMELTFQVPMQYCPLQHRTLSVACTTGVLLWFHLFLLSGVISPLISSSILGTYQPRESSFSVLSFCLFILFMGFSRQECWSGFPFPSLADHILSELSTMTCLSWVALHGGMAHSFLELDKAVVHVIRLVSFLCLWLSVCLPSDREG